MRLSVSRTQKVKNCTTSMSYQEKLRLMMRPAQRKKVSILESTISGFLGKSVLSVRPGEFEKRGDSSTQQHVCELPDKVVSTHWHTQYLKNGLPTTTCRCSWAFIVHEAESVICDTVASDTESLRVRHLPHYHHPNTAHACRAMRAA